MNRVFIKHYPPCLTWPNIRLAEYASCQTPYCVQKIHFTLRLFLINYWTIKMQHCFHLALVSVFFAQKHNSFNACPYKDRFNCQSVPNTRLDLSWQGKSAFLSILFVKKAGFKNPAISLSANNLTAGSQDNRSASCFHVFVLKDIPACTICKCRASYQAWTRAAVLLFLNQLVRPHSWPRGGESWEDVLRQYFERQEIRA